MGVCILAGLGYFYLDNTINKPADTKPQKVPYLAPAPQNIGAVFTVGREKTFIYLDFLKENATVIFADELDISNQIYGYEVTNKFTADYELIGGIVDILGGIDIESDGTVLNYTGTQVVHLLKTASDRMPLRRNIITRILKKIAQTGFTLENMLYIIENSTTDLTVPACYAFIDYLPTTVKTVNFVN